jgi:hypothetical protein
MIGSMVCRMHYQNQHQLDADALEKATKDFLDNVKKTPSVLAKKR